MAEITLRFDAAALSELFDSPSGPVAKELVRVGIQVERFVKEELKQHGTGRIYKLNHPPRIHQASAPDQPPATDLGKYAASIIPATESLEVDSQGLVEKIGTADKRGPWLELGTATMDPRPHLVPALGSVRGP